jgi:hypothetical protein
VESELSQRPIRVIVTDDLARSRLTVFFRLLLAIPHLVWVALWGIAATVVAFVLWLAILIEGRAPVSLHEFVASYLRYATHLAAYLNLAANPYPGFTGLPGYPVDVEIDPPARQGRLGAAFRLVLAVPSLLLMLALGGSTGTSGTASFGYGAAAGATAACAFLGWFACLVLGRMPRGLRDLAAYGIGYSAQALGYLLLLTDRYPSTDPSLISPAQMLPAHPVRVEVADGLARSRLTVFFRLLLALPHLFWLSLWWLVIPLVAIAAWVSALATGRVPSALHRFLAAFTRYSAHLFSFLFVVGGPFPGFVGRQGSYPIDIQIDGPVRQPRLVTLFRLLLAIPAFIVGNALGGALFVVGFLGWWAALFTGRMPGGLRDLGAACIRYNAQATAYALLLTGRYPYAGPALHDRPAPEQRVLDAVPRDAPEHVDDVIPTVDAMPEPA